MLPPIIRKILSLEEQLLHVPVLNHITGRLGSEYLDSHASDDASRYGAATQSLAGHVKLSDSITSKHDASSATAATPKAAGLAYAEGAKTDCIITTSVSVDGLPIVPESLRSGGIIILKK